MPSFTFDPSANGGQGEAVPTSSLRGEEEKPTFTQDQLQAGHHKEVAQNLRKRATDRALMSHKATDEDIDRGSFDPQMAVAEQQLADLQMKLSMETDPTQKSILAAQAEALAHSIVTNTDVRDSEPDVTAKAGNEMEELVNDKLQGRTQEVLQHASDNLDEESIEGFNNLINEGDQELTVNTIEMLQQFQEKPEYFSTEAATALDLSELNPIADALQIS